VDGAAADVADVRLLYATAGVRAVATGMVGVLLGVYLAELRLEPGQIGLVVSAGLAGVAAGTLAVTLSGDRVGHRRALVVTALLTAMGGVVLAAGTSPWLFAVAAFLGMTNGMGRDRGAALVLEHAVLPALVRDAQRTGAFARYNVVQDIGHALGGLAAGLPALLQHGTTATAPAAFRASMAVYAVLCLVPIAAYARLSRRADAPRVALHERVTPATRRILWRIAPLFAMDSLGGGFLTTALLSYFFHLRFGTGVETLGLLFFAARIANAVSHLGAARLARRFGLVNTMVFTHIPSSLLLLTVAVAPNFPVAALLFLLREGLVEMDVPTRQSYVMAVVRPHERTIASGVTNLVRTGAWAVAPAFAGLFMQEGSLVVPLVMGAAIKIAYDLLLWRAFRSVRPPEEHHTSDSEPPRG
jgi:MFS family permease